MSIDYDLIRDTVRIKVLFEGLDIEELGFALEDIQDDTPLVGDAGLALDSVDALEILSLLQKNFGIEVAKVDTKMFAERLATLKTLVDFVAEQCMPAAA